MSPALNFLREYLANQIEHHEALAAMDEQDGTNHGKDVDRETAEELRKALAEIEKWIPRPMSEAPKNGAMVMLFWSDDDGSSKSTIGYWGSGLGPTPEAWRDSEGWRLFYDFTGWIPAPEHTP